MKVRKRDRGGRPPVANETRKVEAIVPAEMVDALDLLADLRGTTRADLIREAVEGLLTADPEEGSDGN